MSTSANRVKSGIVDFALDELLIGLFAFLANQVGALLGVGAAQRRVVVDAVLLQVVECEHGARAIVDDGQRVARPGIVNPVDVEGDRHSVLDIQRRVVPPKQAAIFDVVVDKKCVVEQLDGYR